jgi:hypothetical protein
MSITSYIVIIKPETDTPISGSGLGRNGHAQTSTVESIKLTGVYHVRTCRCASINECLVGVGIHYTTGYTVHTHTACVLIIALTCTAGHVCVLIIHTYSVPVYMYMRDCPIH